jgi:O-antigen ligase
LFIASLSSFAIFSGWVQFLAAYTRETLQLRMMFWRTSLEMVRENFLFGVGAEKYQSVFRDYADASALETIGNLPSPDNAHNYFLHLLATLGFFGAISIILPFLFAVYTLLRERSNQKTIEEVVFRILFLLIWLDLGISVSNVSITVLGMAFLGIILGGESCISRREAKHRIQFLFLSPVLFIVAFGLFFFALDSTKVNREILKLEMKPINLNSSAEISLRVKDLMAIANNSKILKSEIVVIMLDLEALEASRLEILSGG